MTASGLSPWEFASREDAGRRLAKRLVAYRGAGALVLALPRGGVVVGAEIARELHLPMEALIVRKIGHPSNPEYGLGALVEGLPPSFDEDRLRRAGISEADLLPTLLDEQREVERRMRRYREGRPLGDVRGRVVILVDDGIATGVTVRAALRALRTRRPRRIVLAVGVAAPEALNALREEVDELVCLASPATFSAVGDSYRSFDPVADDTVVALLRRRAAPPALEVRS